MRSGDFAVEVIPSRSQVRELESGHILARPGTVYSIRLRNFGPLRALIHLEIDGKPVTQGGLVIDPFSVTDLERPLNEGVTGRFTVAAEGDEAAFGPDGGRDNEKLGLIEARFRRELPPSREDAPFELVRSRMHPLPSPSYRSRGPIEALLWPPSVREEIAFSPEIERAAGTGLTGHSDQTFAPITLGPLEPEATVIQLRLVIATEQAIAEQPVSPVERHAPARPAALP